MFVCFFLDGGDKPARLSSPLCSEHLHLFHCNFPCGLNKTAGGRNRPLTSLLALAVITLLAPPLRSTHTQTGLYPQTHSQALVIPIGVLASLQYLSNCYLCIHMFSGSLCPSLGSLAVCQMIPNPGITQTHSHT